MDLREKVAMITGAAQGIGKATAMVLAGYGADVVACDVNPEGIDQTVSEVQELGRKALAVEMDVSNKANVEQGVQSALKVFGRIDILVNGARICPSAMLQELPEEVWGRVLDINTKGIWLCSQAAPSIRKITNARCWRKCP